MNVRPDIAAREMGLDHTGNPVPSDDPVGKHILSMDPKTPKIELASMLRPLWDIFIGSGFGHAEIEAHMQTLREHFSLSTEALRAHKKDFDDYRKQRESKPKASPPNKDQLLRRLKEQSDVRSINPAQDFKANVMYFAIKIEGKPYLLSSRRELIAFDEAKEHDLILQNPDVDTTRFTPAGIAAYIEKSFNLCIADSYERIKGYIERFIVFTDHRHSIYLTLWAMGTYIHRLFDYYPYVSLNAEKGSGKSLLMKVLAPICFNGEVLINPTEAVIFRDVANNSISMFIDEVEQFRKQDKEAHRALISLLNTGYERNGQVKRAEKTAKGGFVLKSYPTFSPKMFAGINQLDDVLLDRSILLRLLRKKENEKVERYRSTDEIRELQRSIRDDQYVLALENAADLVRLYHDSEGGIRGLDHLANRELDLWEPIMLLANLIDTGIGSPDVTDAMISLSTEMMADKHEVSVTENDTYKALAVTKSMLQDGLQSLNKDECKVVYTTDAVFGYFRNTDEFSWLRDKNKGTLTRLLRKAGIVPGQQRAEGRKTRTYVIDLKVFYDLCERFTI